jgi:hypothetical protein
VTGPTARVLEQLARITGQPVPPAGQGREADMRCEREATQVHTERERHAGWANRETWAVTLWLNNEQGTQEAVHEALREAAGMQTDGFTASKAGDIVREYLEELFDVDTYGGSLPGGLVNMLTDIGSLWRVDWREVGAAFLQDATTGAEL